MNQLIDKLRELQAALKAYDAALAEFNAWPMLEPIENLPAPARAEKKREGEAVLAALETIVGIVRQLLTLAENEGVS